MDRELARPCPPSGPPQPRCPRWCSRAPWRGTAPSWTRRPPASPCSAPRTTPSCSVRCPCPRWVMWYFEFDSINLISPKCPSLMTSSTQHILPCHCHSKYCNNEMKIVTKFYSSGHSTWGGGPRQLTTGQLRLRHGPVPRIQGETWHRVLTYFGLLLIFLTLCIISRWMWGGTWSLVGKLGRVWTWLSTLASICPGSSQGHSISEPRPGSLTAQGSTIWVFTLNFK